MANRRQAWQDFPGVTSYDQRHRYNIYECTIGHHILSMDIDQGVTPMFVSCRLMSRGIMRCGKTASSHMYPAPPVPGHLFPVKLIWRKPTKEELRRARRDNYIDHFDKGGLQMEWIND